MQHHSEALTENSDPKMQSMYPAFMYKPPGIVAQSEEKSSEQEFALCEKLLSSFDCNRYPAKEPVTWIMLSNKVPSILQGFRRPMCGLVALQMGACLLEKLKPETPQFTSEEILSKAVEMGFTIQGEIFSVYTLADLAKTLYDCEVTVVEGQMTDHLLLIVKLLLEGKPVLVPYDNDSNYEPCMRKGHRAHWALVTGVLLPLTKISSGVQGIKAVNGLRNFYKVEDRTLFLNSLNSESFNISLERVRVFAKQGKSSRVWMWSLLDLSKSNANLIERDPEREWSQYHCPYRLEETLNKKFLELHF